MRAQPKYFVTTFGEPYAHKHPVNGACYPHRPGWVRRLGVEEGDVMLLYCAAKYPGHDREAPGIGIVLRTEIGQAEDIIYYRYLPFEQPLKREAIVACLDEAEKRKFTVPHYIANWVIEVKNPASLRKVLCKRAINWP